MIPALDRPCPRRPAARAALLLALGVSLALGAGGCSSTRAGGKPAAAAAPATTKVAIMPTAAPSAVPPAGLGPWTGNDDVPASQQPPGGLRPDQVPMFVSFGFDDNPSVE